MLRPMLTIRLLILLSLVLATACGKQSPATEASVKDGSSAAAPLPDRDSALAHRLVEKEGALLLDVRTPEEFDANHIDGAHNIPYDEVQERLAEIRTLTKDEPKTPIVVYCQSGHRAGKAKKTLVEGGFSQVTNLGGVGDW